LQHQRRLVLIDPDSQAVAEIIMAPAIAGSGSPAR
jgi:hypothetical protein